nr:lysophospholipid acyltransferase family protein [uncultured Flavobacterium sp.]
MQFIIYILIYPILWLISILPFPVFYAFSDVVCFLVYRIIGYRKKTVRYNIALALPHLSIKEQRAVERKFYGHLCDLFLEMIKTLTLSKEEIQKHFVFTNIDLYHKYEAKNKSIVILYGHYASWEWSTSIGLQAKFRGIGVYKKIKNKYFDKLVQHIRSRYNAELVDTKNTIRVVTENQRKGLKAVYGFISDQNPKPQKALLWDRFMGYTVPIHTGGEVLARKLDMNILYLKIEKIARGKYEATFVPLCDEVKETPEFEITKRFLREVEKQILEKPEYYFWTHKRWKYKQE